MNIIIIANGLFPEKPWVDTLLGSADRVVCCDGAIEKYLGWHSRQTLLPDHPVDVTIPWMWWATVTASTPP